jgi:hypothetical protein
MALPVAAGAQPSGLPPQEGAQPSADVSTAAELFQQGRVALEAQDYARARALLLDSARLNPRVGTFISLAQCEEVFGLLASARTHWKQAAQLADAQGDGRTAFARERLAAIDPRVPRLTLVLPRDTPAGTMVRDNDVDLGAASAGLELPVEVGKHALAVVAPGHESWAVQIDLGEGEKREVRLLVGPLTPVVAPGPAAATSPEVPPSDVRGPLRVVSYVALGLGVVGIGFGSYFGVEAIQGKNVPGCSGDSCNGTGTQLRNSALGDGNVSTGLFVAGGALLAAGGVMWFVSRPSVLEQ